MTTTERTRRWLSSLVLMGAGNLGAQTAWAQERATVETRGELALHALMSLSDAHLQKLADVLGLLAAVPDVRSGDWNRIRPYLADAAKVNVPAVLWYALPDGSYWTVQEGRMTRSLADRPYFPQLLAGQRVMGALVVSRSSSRNTAIVAHPVREQGGAIVGALGGSVHLDSLAAILREELGGLDREHLFFALGADGLGALNSDPSLIFTEPLKLGDDEMQRAFRQILGTSEGVVTYTFRGARRTVRYRKSPHTGWWYGFGAVRQ
jgi:hypothetical protein